MDQLYEQISPISSWEHDLLQASAHNYSGYIRREITGNWRVIGDYLQSASELELEGVIEARVAPPNLVAVNGEGWVALATVKPISMTRSEITIAKFGETPEVQWTESWMSIIAKGGFDSIVSGPTAQWAEKFFI
ncbi:hypothetical protein [Enteractinococcus fodinae]|uniref:Uncharacterized protein n=1 Tax=Enteractinococcus fodinae TaxID=684663 RepID=A0ABU2B2V1_9MICC|nr:hypothetical protein [Enteractinococcus fodinae]MDR7347922.1 hypothetical protein [Enteractinococcus fodinae]